MLVVFPGHVLKPSAVDPSFEEEEARARAAGFSVGFVGVDVHFGGELALSVPSGSGAAIYRGWILKAEDHARLERGLAERGYTLVTTRAAYEHCYHFPEWYAALGPERTPRSIALPGASFDMDEVVARVQAEFGDGPVIVKDYVKSRKHDWFDACFIRSVVEADEVRRVVGNFLRLQGDGLVGGLVFRAFVRFKAIGIHSKSRMPQVREYRSFVFRGKRFTADPYWGEGNYEGASPPTDAILADVLPRIQSPFFAIDVAEKEDGSWLVMELNDGGTAGVPDGASVEAFYQRLYAAAGA